MKPTIHTHHPLQLVRHPLQFRLFIVLKIEHFHFNPLSGDISFVLALLGDRRARVLHSALRSALFVKLADFLLQLLHFLQLSRNQRFIILSVVCAVLLRQRRTLIIFLFEQLAHLPHLLFR